MKSHLSVLTLLVWKHDRPVKYLIPTIKELTLCESDPTKIT